MPSADPAVRRKIEHLALQSGWEQVHQRLQQVDPVAAERIHPNDPQRIQRALEVYEISGVPMTEWLRRDKSEPLNYGITKIIVAPKSRALLHERIEARLEQMLQKGFIDEVQTLRQRGDLHSQLPSMRAVGYRQVWQYLDGQFEYSELRNKILFATRQYAKRQLTWLRSESNTEWFDPTDENFTKKVLKKLSLGTIF